VGVSKTVLQRLKPLDGCLVYVVAEATTYKTKSTTPASKAKAGGRYKVKNEVEVKGTRLKPLWCGRGYGTAQAVP
jgi:hypothetical protein